MIPKSLDLPVFNYARVGAERKAKELGNVEILWRGPETADQLRQKEILESFITQGVDGIAISSLNGDFLTETIDRAVAAGIPVVTWDADAPKSKRIAFYGVDDVAAGRIMGEEAARLLGGKGKVAIITSVGATNLQRRLEGVREVLAKQPGHQDRRGLRHQGGLGALRGDHLLRQPPLSRPRGLDLGRRLAGVHAQRARRGGPAKTKFISFDTIPPAPDLLREGKVQVLLGQKYFGWGAEPVRILSRDQGGQAAGVADRRLGVDVVTKDNVDAYVAGWKKLEAGQ